MEPTEDISKGNNIEILNNDDYDLEDVARRDAELKDLISNMSDFGYDDDSVTNETIDNNNLLSNNNIAIQTEHEHNSVPENSARVQNLISENSQLLKVVSEKDSLIKELQGNQKQLLEIKQKYIKSISNEEEHKLEIERLKSDLYLMSQEKSELLNEKEKLEKEVIYIKDKNQNEIKDLKLEISSLTESNNRLSLELQEINTLRSNIQCLEETNNQLVEENLVKDNAYKKLQENHVKEIDDMTSTIENLRAVSADYDLKILRLEILIDNFKANAHNNSKQANIIDDLTSKMNYLNCQHMDLMNRNAVLEENNATLMNERNILKHLLQEKTTANKYFKNDNLLKDTQIMKILGDVKGLKIENCKLEQVKDLLQNELTQNTDITNKLVQTNSSNLKLLQEKNENVQNTSQNESRVLTNSQVPHSESFAKLLKDYTDLEESFSKIINNLKTAYDAYQQNKSSEHSVEDCISEIGISVFEKINNAKLSVKKILSDFSGTEANKENIEQKSTATDNLVEVPSASLNTNTLEDDNDQPQFDYFYEIIQDLNKLFSNTYSAIDKHIERCPKKHQLETLIKDLRSNYQDMLKRFEIKRTKEMRSFIGRGNELIDLKKVVECDREKFSNVLKAWSDELGELKTNNNFLNHQLAQFKEKESLYLKQLEFSKLSITTTCNKIVELEIEVNENRSEITSLKKRETDFQLIENNLKKQISNLERKFKV